MRIPPTATYNPTERDDRPGFYYVSMVDGSQFALLAGPYTSHGVALDMVRAAEGIARLANPMQCAFAGFGTCRLENSAGLGTLHKLGLMSEPRN